MTSYILILFFLGLFSLVINLFNSLLWFTPWWATILMVTSFGIFNRIWQKEKKREKEKMVTRIQELESILKM